MKITWLRIVIGLGGLLALVGFLMTFGGGLDVVGPRIVLIVVFGWLAMGASVAAGVVVVGTAVQFFRKRPLSIGGDRAAFLIPLVVGGGVVGMCLVLSTMQVFPEIVGLGVAGAVLAVAAMWASRAPSDRIAIALIAASILMIEIPRELGWFSMTFERSSYSTTTSNQNTVTCRGSRGPVGMSSTLTGNVGSLIETDDPGEAPTVAEISGHADAGWIACMLPLIKPLSYSTTIHYEVSGRCTGSGDLEIKQSATFWGIKSCRNARQGLAAHLRTELVNAISHR